MTMQLAFGGDSNQPIETTASGRVISLPYTDTDDLVAKALPTESALLFLAKLFCTLCQCLRQVCAGERTLRSPVEVITFRRIDATNR